MKIQIVGRHLRITPEMEAYARDKVSKLDRFFSGIQRVDVVMEVAHNEHLVEMAAVLGQGANLVGKASAADMYAAIDGAETRLQKQVRRFHARLKAHRDRTRISEDMVEARAPASEEETYEKVVREMLEEGGN